VASGVLARPQFDQKRNAKRERVFPANFGRRVTESAVPMPARSGLRKFGSQFSMTGVDPLLKFMARGRGYSRAGAVWQLRLDPRRYVALGGTALSLAPSVKQDSRHPFDQNDIGCSTTSSTSFWSSTISVRTPPRVSHHRSGSKLE
jgi:hypothetical protein